MEESKKLKLSLTKSAPSLKEDNTRDNTYTKTLSHTKHLESVIRASSFSDRIKVNIYEFEKEIYATKVIFQKKQENKKIKKDFKKIILESFLYFNQIKHLPLSFIAKKSNKLIYYKDRKIIERENKDYKIMKKIDKLRNKNELLDEIIVNEDNFLKSKPENKSEGYTVKKLRRYFFKKRKYKVNEITPNKNEVLKKHLEMVKIILKVPLRKKKEPSLKKDYVLHSTIVIITNKVGTELKSYQLPVDYLNFKKIESFKGIDLLPKTSLQSYFDAKNRNSPEFIPRESISRDIDSSIKTKNETENSAQ